MAVIKGSRLSHSASSKWALNWTWYERPSCAFVARFVGDANLLPARVEHADARGARVRTLGADVVVALDGGGRASLSAGEDAVLAVRPEHLAVI